MSDSPTATMPAAKLPSRRWTGRLLPLLLLLICVTGARSLYVSLYSSDIPFWDQWNLLDRTLAPWWAGHWPPLFEPHNEHRIAWTRLISMGLLALNGGVWSNLVESYANTLLYAAVLALFYGLACRGLGSRLSRLALLAGVIVIGSLPFDWENTLVGFQSQFYLTAGAAIVLLGVAAYRSPSLKSLWILIALSVFSLFTMASGLIAPLAVAAILILRMWQEPARLRTTAMVVVAMSALAVAGIVLTPTIAGHAVLKAQGLLEHARAMLTFLIWPMQPLTGKRGLFLLVVWWPLLAWAVRFFRTRRCTEGEWFAVGMLVWVLLQAAAFAHARGHDAAGLSSRYTGLSALGLVANLALALQGLRQLATPVWRRVGVGLLALSMALVAVVFVRRTPFDLAAMHQRHQFLLIEAHYTRAYLHDRNPEDLKHPDLQIPFISGERLREFLNDPAIIRLLPESLTSAIPLPQGAPLHRPSGGQLTAAAIKVQQSVQGALGHTDALPAIKPWTFALSAPAGGSSCYIDAVNGAAATPAITLRVGDALLLDGWLISASLKQSPSFHVLLLGDATFAFSARASGIRGDVVHAMHSQPAATRGFSALGTLEGIPAGSYAIALAANEPDGHIICRAALRLQVLP